jgi:hypothetical protein
MNATLQAIKNGGTALSRKGSLWGNTYLQFAESLVSRKNVLGCGALGALGGTVLGNTNNRVDSQKSSCRKITNTLQFAYIGGIAGMFVPTLPLWGPPFTVFLTPLVIANIYIVD